jgi:hypothetical protein
MRPTAPCGRRGFISSRASPPCRTRSVGPAQHTTCPSIVRTPWSMPWVVKDNADRPHQATDEHEPVCRPTDPLHGPGGASDRHRAGVLAGQADLGHRHALGPDPVQAGEHVPPPNQVGLQRILDRTEHLRPVPSGQHRSNAGQQHVCDQDNRSASSPRATSAAAVAAAAGARDPIRSEPAHARAGRRVPRAGHCLTRVSGCAGDRDHRRTSLAAGSSWSLTVGRVGCSDCGAGHWSGRSVA